MNWKKILWIAVGVVLVGGMMLKLIRNKQTTKQKVYQYDRSQPVAVKVDTIVLKTMDESQRFTGTFEPDKESKISAEVQGKINGILADLGQYVRKGQPLIQLDNSLLKLQLQSVDVQIGGLEKDVKRFGILTQADAVQGVQLEKAMLGLESAKVQRATLLEQINKTTIRAPFNGIVTAKFNEEGAFAAPGVPLLQITDIANLRFTIQVPEGDLQKFRLHQQFSISADVYPDVVMRGKVNMIGSKSHAGNNFPIQFQVTNTRDLAIKSGMFGKVIYNKMEMDKAVVVPSSAIMEEGGKSQVYLIRDGKAYLRSVAVSKSAGNNTVILEGITPGDVIVTSGFIDLFEGSNVEVKN